MLFSSLILVPMSGTLMISFFNVTLNDAAEPWGLFFQENATPQMEGLEELHNNIMFYLAIILFAVSWIMLSIILDYNKATISKSVNRGTLVELIFCITFASIVSGYFFIEESKIILLNIFDNILFSNDVNGQASEGEIATITETITPSDCPHDKAKYNWNINSVNLCQVCRLEEANLICELCSCNLHPECAPSTCDFDGDWKND